MVLIIKLELIMVKYLIRSTLFLQLQAFIKIWGPKLGIKNMSKNTTRESQVDLVVLEARRITSHEFFHGMEIFMEFYLLSRPGAIFARKLKIEFFLRIRKRTNKIMRQFYLRKFAIFLHATTLAYRNPLDCFKLFL